MAGRLENKVAIVTGAASRDEGIGNGKAIALLFAREGARVVLVNRSQERADGLCQEIIDQGGVAIAVAGDMTCATDTEAVVAAAESTYGRLDILCNNIGIGAPGKIADVTEAQWNEVIDTNLKSVMLCTRAAIPAMQRANGGSVINISSVAGLRAGTVGGVAYNASKFGMSALGITVAEEHREMGIRVTNVYPGEVETPILDNRPVPVSAEHRARILQPEDCADAVMMVVRLPARANVPELVIIPTTQSYK